MSAKAKKVITILPSQPQIGFDYKVYQTKMAIVDILNDSGLPQTTLESILFELKTISESETQRSIQNQKTDYEKQLESIKLANSPTLEEFKKDNANEIL